MYHLNGDKPPRTVGPAVLKRATVGQSADDTLTVSACPAPLVLRRGLIKIGHSGHAALRAVLI